MANVHVYVRNPALPRGWERGISIYWACPYCRTIGTHDDFDTLGLDGDSQCLSCGKLVVPVDVKQVEEFMPLFEGVR